jgi:endo-1,4-beta-D-glucanase Y
MRIALAWLGTSLLAAWLGAGCAAGGSGSDDLEFGGSEEPGSSTTGSMNGTGAGTSASTGAGGASNTADASTSGAGGLAPSTSGRSLVNPMPTPPTGNTKFPFPQNRVSASCVYPFKAFNGDVQTAYGVWKSKFLTTTGAQGELRVQRAENGNDTVSEGIAYGMIIALYMGEQTPFDQLWRYALRFMDGKGLMNWHIRADGSGAAEMGSATDADEDMAWALVMADRQWGGKGTLQDTYLNYGKSLIQKIWQNDIDHGRGEMVKPGDGWMEDKTNPSYFAPAYYKVFAKVTGDVNWNKVVDSSYNIINQSLTHGNASNGLVPDWCSSNGSPQGDYKYDACRTPFRIALDACLFSEARAKTYLSKTSSFFSGVGVVNIKDGYTLSGTPTGAGLTSAFLGPAASGAMSSATYQNFLDEGYIRMMLITRTETRYFSGAWGMMSLLMMTANFLDYTQY